MGFRLSRKAIIGNVGLFGFFFIMAQVKLGVEDAVANNWYGLHPLIVF